MSLTIIQTGRPTIWKFGCDFLFAVHSNYGRKYKCKCQFI